MILLGGPCSLPPWIGHVRAGISKGNGQTCSHSSPSLFDLLSHSQLTDYLDILDKGDQFITKYHTGQADNQPEDKTEPGSDSNRRLSG